MLLSPVVYRAHRLCRCQSPPPPRCSLRASVTHSIPSSTPCPVQTRTWPHYHRQATRVQNGKCIRSLGYLFQTLTAQIRYQKQQKILLLYILRQRRVLSSSSSRSSRNSTTDPSRPHLVPRRRICFPMPCDPAVAVTNISLHTSYDQTPPNALAPLTLIRNPLEYPRRPRRCLLKHPFSRHNKRRLIISRANRNVVRISGVGMRFCARQCLHCRRRYGQMKRGAAAAAQGTVEVAVVAVADGGNGQREKMERR